MAEQTANHPTFNHDPLSDYVSNARKLPHALGLIAENQRHSASSLSRAAAALRSMAALNNKPTDPNSRNRHLTTENAKNFQ